MHPCRILAPHLVLGFFVSETCITGMVLSILSYFEYEDTRLDTIAALLLEQQMPDGGWNCQRPKRRNPRFRSIPPSAYLKACDTTKMHRGGDLRAVASAQQRSREFLLVHRLFRSTVLAKSSNLYSLGSLSLLDGIMTFFAHWIISKT